MRNTHCRDRVRWIAGRTPDSEEARAVFDAITRKGLTTYGEVAAAVAEELFGRDLARVGSLSDIGIFRAWYVRGACRLLDRLDGTAIAIE
jgi:hypothetical protein